MESTARLFGHSGHQMLIIVRLAVGVEDGPNLNALSSLRARHVRG